MTNETLLQMLMENSEVVEGSEGGWRCMIEEVPVVCMTDDGADRMRFMAPIPMSIEVTPALLVTLLEANFHSALDARLALHDSVLWALFVSPLSLLTPEMARNGLTQVVQLATNASAGDYRSGPWQFET
jgi:hypothetical protein